MDVDSDNESGRNRQLKIQLWDKFYGDRRQTRAFITQLRIYFKLAQNDLKNEKQKIFLIISLFRKTVLSWIQLMMKDYLNNPPKNRKDVTKKIFFDKQTLSTR